MKTANPRIPSPFDTAGMFAGCCAHSGLIRTKKGKMKHRGSAFSLDWTGVEDGQLGGW